jgi:hypothetical protein
LKPLEVPDEDSMGNFILPKPPKSKGLETNMNINLGSGKANSSSTTTNLKSIFRMEKSNEVFRTSASSYEGIKSHYTSNNEVIGISTFSPKEYNNTQEDAFCNNSQGNNFSNNLGNCVKTKAENTNTNTNEEMLKNYTNQISNFTADKDYEGDLNLNTTPIKNDKDSQIIFKEENNSISNSNNIDLTPPSVNNAEKSQTLSLLNNIKLIYDQNTDRNKKRLEQMRKMRSNRCSEKNSNYDEDINNNEEKHEQNINDKSLSSSTNPQSLRPHAHARTNSITLINPHSTFTASNISTSKSKKIIYTNTNTNASNSSISEPTTRRTFNPITKAYKTDTETEESFPVEKVSFEAEETNINNEDAEVMVSDLDCSLDEGDNTCNASDTNINTKNKTNTVTNNVYALANKTFVPIKNALVTKNAMKEDNATPSYLMALGKYEDEEEDNKDECNNFNNHPDEDFKNQNSSNNYKDILIINLANYDSLEKDSNYEKANITIASKSQSGKEIKHVRWPSLKNFACTLVNSIIEEEVNETYTDSEISQRKKSFMFTKSKMGSSEKKLSLGGSRDFVVEKNLDNLFRESLTGVKTVSVNLNVNEFNLGNEYIPNNISNSTNTKLPTTKTPLISHKTAKSEIFNLQIDLKKTLDEISKKINNEDEVNKLKVEHKKKELMDKFFKSGEDNINTYSNNNTNIANSLSAGISSMNINKSNVSNNPSNIGTSASLNKIVIKFKSTSDNISDNSAVVNTNMSSPNIKKVASLSKAKEKEREKYYENYLTNNDSDKATRKLTEIQEEIGIKNSIDDFDIILSSPIIAREATNNKDNNNILCNNSNYSNALISNAANLHKMKKEKYKRERKKSSIFKSEDLRISKAEANTYNYISPKINNVYNNYNNNISSTSNMNILLSTAKIGYDMNNTPNAGNNNSTILDQCSYININNNINILSPISVNSITNINDNIGNDAIKDKTMINPFDLMKNITSTTSINPIDIADYEKSNIINSSNKKPTCLNFNLTISNNNIEEVLSGGNLIRRNLFETGIKDLDNKEKIQNNEKNDKIIGNTTNTLKTVNKGEIIISKGERFTTLNPTAYSEMSISNEICLDIVPKAKIDSKHIREELRMGNSTYNNTNSNIKHDNISSNKPIKTNITNNSNTNASNNVTTHTLPTKNRKASMDLLLSNIKKSTGINNIINSGSANNAPSTGNKHNKTASMNLLNLNSGSNLVNNPGNSQGNINLTNLQTHMNNILKTKNKNNLNLNLNNLNTNTINTANSGNASGTIKAFLEKKKRSTSGSSHKYTQSESSATLTNTNSIKNFSNLVSHTHSNSNIGVNTFHNINTNSHSHYTNTSPFSRASNNGKTDRDISPNTNKISLKLINHHNSNINNLKTPNTIRTSTPEINKNKKNGTISTITSDLKSMFNFSSSKKDKEKDVKKHLTNSNNNLEEKDNMNNINNLNLKKSIANAIVPKIPKSKPTTYRTYSEVPAAYTSSAHNYNNMPSSNKLKVLETLKYLNYPKTPNGDVFKNALEKLSQCKALNFVILVEHKKGYVRTIKNKLIINL